MPFGKRTLTHYHNNSIHYSTCATTSFGLLLLGLFVALTYTEIMNFGYVNSVQMTNVQYQTNLELDANYNFIKVLGSDLAHSLLP